MNEPLTTSKPEVVFTGKTYNKHPHWNNQPLRLTEEQLENPILTFEDFFQSYHLNETREVLWQWLLAVISSDGSISNEPLERSNHFYFYEKLEEVIEAAFIIKTNQLTANQSVTSKDDVSSTQVTEQEVPENPGTILNKEKRLIEYVNDAPLYVIHQVLKPGNWCFISIALKEWLEIGMSAEDSAYDDAEDRQNLIVFNDQLLLLVESLFIINLKNISDITVKERLHDIYTPHLLNKDQKADPIKVVAAFFEKYPNAYIMRELDDWLAAGVDYAGPWRNEITSPWYVLNIYREVVCLIKSAEQLLKNGFTNQ
jgi:hypothetical protein